MAGMSVPNVCVECRRAPSDPVWRPFCSERCRNLDLARWVDGSYRIAAEPAPDAESDGDGQ
jgi:endogenous inhibitor of DNA gyrase (YacG/DUF329 family)